MSDDLLAKLRPATPEELQQALVHALKFNGRRQFQSSRDAMAEITAAHLAEALRAGLFVVMKAPAPEKQPGCAYAESVARVKAGAIMPEWAADRI
jgi:hypothetical protein